VSHDPVDRADGAIEPGRHVGRNEIALEQFADQLECMAWSSLGCSGHGGLTK
jgi:hypothetical protein